MPVRFIEKHFALLNTAHYFYSDMISKAMIPQTPAISNSAKMNTLSAKLSI